MRRCAAVEASGAALRAAPCTAHRSHKTSRAAQRTCAAAEKRVVATINNYTDVKPKSEDQLAAALMLNPVSVAIEAVHTWAARFCAVAAARRSFSSARCASRCRLASARFASLSARRASRLKPPPATRELPTYHVPPLPLRATYLEKARNADCARQTSLATDAAGARRTPLSAFLALYFE